jgi:hypothetical protein
MAELLEEIARGHQDPGSILDHGRLDAEKVAAILHSLAADRFHASLPFVRVPCTMAKHINGARKRLKTGSFA